MIIVYESKTGFTRRYAEMLAAQTGMKLFSLKERPKFDPDEEMIYLGWMKVGKVQGLDKVNKLKIAAVCLS